MEYYVIIKQDEEIAELLCATLEEAKLVKQSFLNYGKFESINIEERETNVHQIL